MTWLVDFVLSLLGIHYTIACLPYRDAFQLESRNPVNDWPPQMHFSFNTTISGTSWTRQIVPREMNHNGAKNIFQKKSLKQFAKISRNPVNDWSPQMHFSFNTTISGISWTRQIVPHEMNHNGAKQFENRQKIESRNDWPP